MLAYWLHGRRMPEAAVGGHQLLTTGAGAAVLVLVRRLPGNREIVAAMAQRQTLQAGRYLKAQTQQYTCPPRSGNVEATQSESSGQPNLCYPHLATQVPVQQLPEQQEQEQQCGRVAAKAATVTAQAGRAKCGHGFRSSRSCGEQVLVLPPLEPKRGRQR